jgi:hypothetical protein
MADDAENMGLMSLIIDGVAHGLAVDGQTFVLLSIGLVPTLQGLVQLYGIDANQDLADNRFTGDILYSLCQEKDSVWRKITILMR